MTTEPTSLATVYQGWDVYQGHLTKALAPLTAEQLTLRAAPHLRSLYEIAAHIIGARARWLSIDMGEGAAELGDLGTWDRPTAPHHSAAELVQALETSWSVLQGCLARWTTADLAYVYEGDYHGEAYSDSRQWILWHLIEHDVHHGGELSFLLGMYHLPAPDL